MPKARVSHPIFARVYSWNSPKADTAGFAAYRQRLLAGLSGRVIDVGAGNGLNFAYYPREVSRVLAVEPEPYLRTLAERAAATATVEVVDGTAEQLPTGDATMDAAVTSLVLCSVGDPAAALEEVRRVVRPGGQLRVLEHVRAETPVLRRIQRVLDATVWPALVGGCHTHRDTAASIERAGFTIERLERFRFPPSGVPMPASPCILAVATRP